MTKKLWVKKGWQKLNSNLEDFESGPIEDHPDNKLILADIFGSLAHAKMLYKIGILDSHEFQKIEKSFQKIYNLYKSGQFILIKGEEDIHTKIENFLIQYCGEAGKKIHAGRSRNDQVLLAIRIYAKEELISIVPLILELAKVLLLFAQKYEFVPVAGYTHMQKAMPSSIGLWASSFVESLLDDTKAVKFAYELNDQSPLGSAASYGTSVPVDRKFVAGLLGFSKVQKNVLYCQNSRGKVEAAVIFSFCEIAETLSKLAEDVLLFSMTEFGYFEAAGDIVTGSSIMPQKKNLDALELIRGKPHLLYGYLMQMLTLISGLPSGYNKDVKETKKLLVEGVTLIKSLLKSTTIALQGLQVDEDKCLKSLTKEVFAADFATELVLKKKLAFRKAYQTVGENLNTIPTFDPVKNIKSKKHLGATGNLGLGKLAKEIQELEVFWSNQKKKHKAKLLNLFADKNQIL